MNFQQIIQELKNYHTDMIMWRNRIKQWVDGVGSYVVGGQIPFPWSDGTSTTLDTLPTVISKAQGAMTKEAYENLGAGAPVKLLNDGGVYKVARLRSRLLQNTALNNGVSSDTYYSSYFGAFLTVYKALDDSKVTGKIGTVDIDNNISYGAEIELDVAGSMIMILPIDTIHFIVTYSMMGHIFALVGKFTSASTIQIGVPFDITGVTSAATYTATIDSAGNTLAIAYHYVDGTNKYNTLLLSINRVGLSCTLIAGSDKEVASALAMVNSYTIAYNSVDQIFHTFYVTGDGTNYILSHKSINRTTGALGSLDELLVYADSDNVMDSIGLTYDTNEGVLVHILGYHNIITGSDLYVERYSVASGNVTVMSRKFVQKYNAYLVGSGFYNPFSKPLFASDGNVYVIYRVPSVAGLTYFVCLDLLENAVKYNIYYGTITAYDDLLYKLRVAELDGRFIFGSADDVNSYVFSNDDRNKFYGIVNVGVLAGEDAEVIVTAGITTGYAGLSQGLKYYLQGSNPIIISTARTEYPIGIALSDTELKLY